MVSRMDVAAYLADGLKANRKRTVREVAAWLISTRRSGEVGYLTQDVARILADHGYLYGRLVTAHQLAQATRQVIEAGLKRQFRANHIELDYGVDASVIGGLRLELPGQILDGTIQAALQHLVDRVSGDE